MVWGKDMVPGMIALSGGVPVTFDGVTVLGIETREDVEILKADGAVQLGKRHAVVVPTDSLPGLEIGESIVVNGVHYVIRQLDQQRDLHQTEIGLSL